MRSTLYSLPPSDRLQSRRNTKWKLIGISTSFFEQTFIHPYSNKTNTINTCPVPTCYDWLSSHIGSQPSKHVIHHYYSSSGTYYSHNITLDNESIIFISLYMEKARFVMISRRGAVRPHDYIVQFHKSSQVPRETRLLLARTHVNATEAVSRFPRRLFNEISLRRRRPRSRRWQQPPSPTCRLAGRPWGHLG